MRHKLRGGAHSVFGYRMSPCYLMRSCVLHQRKRASAQPATFGGGSSGGSGGVSAPSVGSVGGGQEQQQQPLTQRFVNINLYREFPTEGVLSQV